MSQSAVIVAAILAAFFVYITTTGSLKTYLSFVGL